MFCILSPRYCFYLVSCASITKNVCPGLALGRLCACSSFVDLLNPFLPITAGSCGNGLLSELYQQLTFVGFPVVFVRKTRAWRGYLFNPKRKHLVLLLSILVGFRSMRMAFKARKLLLGNYLYEIMKNNVSTSLSFCAPHPPTWWHWYRFTEMLLLNLSSLVKKTYWQNPLLTLCTWGFVH